MAGRFSRLNFDCNDEAGYIVFSFGVHISIGRMNIGPGQIRRCVIGPERE